MFARFIFLILLCTGIHAIAATDHAAASAVEAAHKKAPAKQDANTPAIKPAVCANIENENLNPKNAAVDQSVQTSTSPLMRAFQALKKSVMARTQAGFCIECSRASAKKSGIPAKIQLPTKNIIKRECILAALKRDIQGTAVTCDTHGKERKIKNSGKSAPCLTNPTVDYLYYAVNQAIDCLSTKASPLDAKFVLKKMNNETGFNFALASRSGTGVGQVISSPVDELAGWHSRGRFIPGNGNYVLEEVVNSKNPSCAPFKAIIQKDLQSPPPTPTKAANFCDWVNPGDGLARSLIYSIGYFRHARDYYVTRIVKDTAPELLRNKEVMNNLTLVAYSAGGNVAVQTTLDRYYRGKGINAATFLKKIRQNNTYLRAVDNKMSELSVNLKGEKIDSIVQGDACISH
jgi:hypothetical protein